MCSRLANTQLEKEKAELIHQLEVDKDQSGAESTVPGKVFSTSRILAKPSFWIRVFRFLMTVFL